ncbi:hypothetical protein IYY11_01955 [Methylocystis sp. H62]|uniref:YCF48-related protein n=1 Tax=Methylocystis sp. H62 TaxID=2785789 RepID=UPI0018C229AC|nr:YCF48-related protein [Methylocystis sp. H62]MBG0792239.1 hypothetical protein [Methylocystis sp. H62]
MPKSFENFSWRRTHAPGSTTRGYRTDDVWFADATTGWAVNSEGNIIKTVDGGDSWVVQAGFEDVYLRSVGFADKMIGWVGTLTPTQRLLHTKDGGASWSLVANLPAGAPPAICGLSVVDANTIYASGTNFPDQPTAVIKTTDGGASWTAIDMSAHAAILVDIYFKNALEGWVVGGRDDVGRPMAERVRDDVKPVVLHTTDGGATWTDRIPRSMRRFFPRGEWGWKIQALDEEMMFVSLENMLDGAILRSDDGGLSWRRIPINDRQRNANLEGIGFLDRDRGWVGGWGDVNFTGGFTSATVDGGKNWDNANQVGFRLNRFRFIGKPVAVAYASGDTVYKFTDQPAPAVVAAAVAAPEDGLLRSKTAVDIETNVPEGARRLKINIWDRFGRHVNVLANEIPPAAGARRFNWNFCGMGGEALPAGAYIVRITIDGLSQSLIAYKAD